MSGTGSMMIRNLRKPTDYAKAVQTQDELLRIAIANDMNVAEARKLVQQGEVLMPTPQDLKSPAELQQDYAFQEKTAIENLLQLFRYNEIGQIISNLSPDEIFVLNSSFPSIKQDFTTRFNPKLITPTFFIEYLRRFALELNASKGVTTNLAFITNKFNDLTDNIQDIRANMPTGDQFNAISRQLDRVFIELPKRIVTPVIQRINALEEVLPSKEYFDELEKSNKVYKFETLSMLQGLTDNLPTKDQLNKLIEDINSGKKSQQEGFEELQNMLSEVNMSQIEALQALKTELVESGKLGRKQSLEIKADVRVGIPNVPTLAVGRIIKASGIKTESLSVFIVYDEENSEELTAEGLKKIYKSNPDFKQFYNSFVGKPPPKKEPSITELKGRIMSSSKAGPSDVSDITDITGTTFEKSGSGIAKNGRVLSKIKIGKGVEYEAEPTYRQLGKYVVNMPQLKNRDILNVKFRSLGRIPQLKPIPISEVTKEFILELLDTGKASHRIYDQIPIEERQYFERVATGAGIINNLKLKRTLTEEDIKDNERFALLRGEYVAGNNSSTLLKELRKLVVKFMNSGKITKTDGTNLLIELSV